MRQARLGKWVYFLFVCQIWMDSNFDYLEGYFYSFLLQDLLCFFNTAFLLGVSGIYIITGGGDGASSKH